MHYECNFFWFMCVEVLIRTRYVAVTADWLANGIQTNIVVPTMPMPSW